MSDSFATPWTVAYQVPLSMGVPRQEYWSRLLFPSLGDLPDPGIEPTLPALAGEFFTTEPPGKPMIYIHIYYVYISIYNQNSNCMLIYNKNINCTYSLR